MKPFTIVTGAAAVLPHANIDTDTIIRIERLTEEKQTALGDYAFEALRFLPDGREDPQFCLNLPGWRDAPILIAGPNFGCGSSREGAVVALVQRGIRVIVAHSFGDIFYSNCFQNGVLPIRLPVLDVNALMEKSQPGGAPFTVDLTRQLMIDSVMNTYGFEIEPTRREGLLAGLDDLGLTLRDAAAIEAWQLADRAHRPWAWNSVVCGNLTPLGENT